MGMWMRASRLEKKGLIYISYLGCYCVGASWCSDAIARFIAFGSLNTF